MMHAWGPPVRPDHHTTYRGCMRPGCGLCWISRHEDREHWAEYLRMPDEAMVVMSGNATPPCGGNI